MEIREAITINAEVETVWLVFTEIERWGEWNKVCRECRFENGDDMKMGRALSFELSPVIFSVRITPVIDLYIEGEQVTWSGAKWGISARHSFVFKKLENRRTILESIETFSGPMIWAARLTGVHKRLHELTRAMLRSIKAEAELRTR